MTFAAPSRSALICVATAFLLTPAAGAGGPTGRYAGRPVQEVLRELQAAGLPILFSSQIVRADLVVREEPRAASLRQIAEEVLAPHGLALREGPNGTLLVVARPRPKSESSGARVSPDSPPVRGFVAREDILVSPSSFRFRREEPESRRILSQEEIARSPHIGDDPLRAVNQLPGTTPGDLSAKFRVRGGADDEVLVSYDGQELVNPYHLKDFLSAFTILDARAVGGVDVFTGGFPVRYGRKASGVIDLTTDAPSPRLRGALGISLVSAYAFAEGPFAGQRGHWLVSARKGFLKYALSILNGSELDPSYSDAYSRIDFRLTEAASVSANVLTAQDDITFTGRDNPEHVRGTTSDLYGWMGLQFLPNERLFVETSLAAGRIRDRRNGTLDDGRLALDVRDFRQGEFVGARQNWSFALSQRHSLDFGFQVQRVSARYRYFGTRRVFDPGLLASGLATETTTSADLSPHGTEASAYISDQAKLSGSVTAELGLRWDRETYSGANRIDPRLNLVWAPGASTIVRAAWGLFSQPRRVWELHVGDGETSFPRAERAEHRILSIERALPGGSTVRVEAYQKKISPALPRYENVLTVKERIPELLPDRVRIAPDRAEAKGVEVLLATNPQRRFSGWIAYSWASAEDHVDGSWVPRSWDARHSVHVDLNWRPGARWNINTAWIYHSGWPTTRVSGLLVESPDGSGPVIEPIIGPRNGERFSSYHRMDLRITRSVPLRRGALTAFLEITNLYDRRNPCCVDQIDFSTAADGSVQVRRTDDDWIRALPSFGIEWSF
jgi:hypothetical protein